MPAKSKKSEDTRKKIYRLIAILRKLDSRERCTPASLAEHFNVTDRTIQRDIEVLNSAGFSIFFDKESNTYRFTNPDYTLRDLEINKDELVVLLFGKQLAHSLGKPFEKAYQSLLKKVRTETGRQTRDKVKKIEERRQFWVDIEPVEGFEKIETQYNMIVAAMDKGKGVEIVYKAMKNQEETKRNLSPYGLFLHQGMFYVIGYCHLRKAIRVFAMDCIKDIKLTEKSYVIPGDFKLEEYFKTGWNMLRYGEPVEVVLEFDKTYARWIKRKKWHPTQVIEEQKDGSIIFKVTVQGTKELKWWTYHWIPYCKILSPPELRKEAVEEMRTMLEVYGRDA